MQKQPVAKIWRKTGAAFRTNAGAVYHLHRRVATSNSVKQQALIWNLLQFQQGTTKQTYTNPPVVDNDLLRLSLRLFKRKTMRQDPGPEKTEDAKLSQMYIPEMCMSWAIVSSVTSFGRSTPLLIVIFPSGPFEHSNMGGEITLLHCVRYIMDNMEVFSAHIQTPFGPVHCMCSF